ncbi:diguanylate cyclase [Actinoplanes sp. NPDC023801]|uniref:diguanylate cyclase n=1 Tax=Actinoplanes sp. NPDC023801 TaxID=3154595 RepID=UPI0033DEDB70
MAGVDGGTVDAGLADALTGALGRAAMQRRIDEEIARAGRTGGTLALLLFDVDFFKTVNDVYGHLRGDDVLRELAATVTGALRDGDVLFRYGGDEFVVLLPGIGRTGGLRLAVHLIDTVKAAEFPGDPPLHLSVSLGVAAFPDDGTDQLALLACADRRNFLAKRRGRGCAVADDTDVAQEAGPGRLWERDAALATVHEFLTRLESGGRGALRVTGQPGAGHTRFLDEIRRLAGLRGYAVADVTADGRLTLPEEPQRTLLLADTAASPLVADVVAAVLAAPADRQPAVFGVVYAVTTTSAVPAPALPELAGTELHAWSPAVIRIWLRSVLRGEPSRTLVTWLARQSGGLPAPAAAELERLRDRGGLIPSSTGGWTVNPALLRNDRSRTRLPAQMTQLIGRDDERDQVSRLLRTSRLVTLVGMGGIGKTRLALAAAAVAAADFDDGAVFVPLDTSTGEDLVIAAVARALRVDESPGQDPLDSLLDHLSGAGLLLVLDNFEHVIETAPLVEQVLAAAPAVTVLVTSREALGLYGEQIYRVPALGVPDPGGLSAGVAGVTQARLRSPAVALFEQRATAARPDFQLTPANLPAVVELCRLLDGLPLAIELAAAGADRAEPAALLADLGGRLAALGDGPRHRPRRQQTLRGAIDWSLELLTEDQQRILVTLSVFTGGCGVEAATAVCRTDGSAVDLAGVLATLAAKSLLTVEMTDDGRRYRMLETVRAYAAEVRAAAYPHDRAEARHAAYFASFAERAAAGMESPEQLNWADRLERDYPNLRSAIDRALRAGDPDSAARICLGLWRYWRQGSHIREGREWMDRVLAATGDARLYYPAAVLAATQDDHLTATDLGLRGLELARAAGDRVATAQAHNVLGAARLAAGRYPDAEEHFRQSLAIWQELGEDRGTAMALGNLAKLSLRVGRVERAGEYINECLARERAAGNSGGILLGLEVLGDVLRAQDRLPEARDVLTESLALSRDLGDMFGEAMALHQLGTVASASGDAAGALRLLQESIQRRQEVGDHEGLTISLESVAELIVGREPELAVRLLAVTDALRERFRLPVPPESRPQRESVLVSARSALGERTFAAAGRAAPPDLVIDQVLDLDR